MENFDRDLKRWDYMEQQHQSQHESIEKRRNGTIGKRRRRRRIKVYNLEGCDFKKASEILSKEKNLLELQAPI